MKRIILPLVLMTLVMYACSSVSDHSEENIALVEKYIKAVEDLDHDAMENMLDDNYLGLGPSFGDSIGKAQAVINWKNNVDNLYEKIAYTRSRNAAVVISSGENQGDWVTNWAELQITYKDGRGKVVIWANSIYQIENGKILKSYTFYNEADALEQLGYVFINPNDL